MENAFRFNFYFFYLLCISSCSSNFLRCLRRRYVLFAVIAKLQTHFIKVLQQNVTLHLIHVLNLFILEFIFLIIGFMVNVYIFGHPTEKMSEFINLHLHPHVEDLPSYLNNTTGYLHKTPSSGLTDHTLLVTMVAYGACKELRTLTSVSRLHFTSKYVGISVRY